MATSRALNLRTFVLSIIAFVFGFAGTGANASSAAKCGAGTKCSGPQSRFGSSRSTRKAMPAEFRLVVWNIYKGEGLSGQQSADLKSLAKKADLILIQDATDKRDFTSNLKNARPDFSWNMAKASELSTGHWAGVVTGTNVKMLSSKALRSPGREPVTGNSRSAMLSEFRVARSPETLLVINLQALSFAGDRAFEAQLKQTVAAAKRHRGPLVLAGDFSSWRESRMKLVMKHSGRLGLENVKMPRSALATQGLVLVRGLKVQSADEVDEFYSSNQKPVVVTLSVQPKIKLAEL